MKERPVSEEWIGGRNPVREALRSGRPVEKLLVLRDAEGSAGQITRLAQQRGLPVQRVDREALDRLYGSRNHQGVLARIPPRSYADLDQLLAGERTGEEASLLVLLDGLEDPHNLGAILRSADGAGAHGLIIPARRSVGLTAAVAKASAGAIEYVPVARVTNLVAAMEELKTRGLWVVGLDMAGEPYTQVDLTGPLALVVGGEGKGLSALTKKRCDRLISIPMQGRLNSLNASNAAAVALFEVQRQRQAAREREE